MNIKKHADELILILALICLYFTSVYSYLLFHTISEMFSIIIGVSIFIIAWNTRKFSQSDYFIFLGIAYLFVSGIDFIHTLAYKGMSIFIGYDANLPTQLWILARYIQSISLLISPIFITRKVNTTKVFISYFLAVGFFMASIFYWDIFPTCFVEGKGLTQFKIISEYIISIILLFGLYFLHKRKAKLDDYIYKLIVLSILLTIAGEITFTTYLSVYGFSNMLGHYFKVIAFFLIYKALIASNLENPYSMLFRELKESEKNYANLFNKMLSGFASHEIILDEDGNPCDYRFIDVNPAFERMIGLKKKDIIGKTVLEVMPRTEQFWIDRYGKVALEETPVSFSSYSIELDKHFDVTAFSPKKGFFAAIFRDITEKRKAEEKINGLNEALKVLNKILRHDILNDLTVVMSACDMIQVDDQRLKQKAAKALNKSVSLIEQMRELENALASDEDLSGKSLRSVAESVVKNYPDIKFRITGDCTILCDEAIYSAMDNLIRNAVVHGKADRIDITIADNCEMRITDYGKGIPSDVKDKIFGEGESFGDTRGSGLGLYIVKKVMERYGGIIRVEDNKPNGAVFILKFKKA